MRIKSSPRYCYSIDAEHVGDRPITITHSRVLRQVFSDQCHFRLLLEPLACGRNPEFSVECLECTFPRIGNVVNYVNQDLTPNLNLRDYQSVVLSQSLKAPRK